MREVHEEALAQMRRHGGRWAAYENQAMDSSNAGHMQFLRFGPACTYAQPPSAYPADTVHGMGWRYVLIGEVGLNSGVVGPVQS